MNASTKNKSIVFMGTSDFSLKTLVALYEAQSNSRPNTRLNLNIVGVYTQRPKPVGRNHEIQQSAVHKFAEEKGIPVYCPKNFRSAEEVEFFKSLNPDLAIVSSYGLIIPQSLLDIPPYGFINVHASLLPRWRGAAPIQSAILAGDEKTGITIMKMDAGVDTGDIISMKSVDISMDTTYGELANRLGDLGASMILETLDDLENNLQRSIKQPQDGATYAKKIDKDSCKINWNDSAENILRFIKAFSPTPAAWTEIGGVRIKILDAAMVTATSMGEETSPQLPGHIGEDLVISCGVGSLVLTEIQPAGKNRMSGKEFIRGRKNLIGYVIGSSR